MTNPIAMPSQTKKGSPALYISPIVVSGEATPFITKSTKPKGGVVVAISMLISMMVPNQSGLKPRLLTIGI